ncbi:MAG TPA: glycosyltransferase, partial [Acidobacteriota bacterium]|nr:glycosyltransferase [Acidobacteriota bacterium]
MFCSVIIPTIGRSTLTRAVESVLSQQLRSAEFEVIVVNDSGQPLPFEAWRESDRIRILDTNRRERSFARNAGAAVAVGDYLYFLDDDDWLLPGGLAAFQELARQAPEAAWLYGGVRIVDETGSCLAERNSGLQGACLAQVMGGAWIPIQSSLIRTQDFFAVGGFDPLIRGTEDQDLCRRTAARGVLGNTPKAIACLFRGAGWNTSTDYSRAAEDTRASRDFVTDQAGTFRLMVKSADNAYWRGRVVHVYLSLAYWNCRRRRF